MCEIVVMSVMFCKGEGKETNVSWLFLGANNSLFPI